MKSDIALTTQNINHTLKAVPKMYFFEMRFVD